MTMLHRLLQPIGGAPAWAIALLATAAIVLVPWSVALTVELPAEHSVRHWDIAWAGLDAWLAIILIATVVAALRKSPWLPSLGLAAAAVLVCDAWFDVVTSDSRLDLWLALGTAMFLELPLAAVGVLISRSALAFARPPRPAPHR